MRKSVNVLIRLGPYDSRWSTNGTVTRTPIEAPTERFMTALKQNTMLSAIICWFLTCRVLYPTMYTTLKIKSLNIASNHIVLYNVKTKTKTKNKNKKHFFTLPLKILHECKKQVYRYTRSNGNLVTRIYFSHACSTLHFHFFV